MRIVCPSCAAEYDVPDERLPPRRMVRCVACGGEWMPVREITEDEPPPPPEPIDEMPEIPAITALDRLATPLPSQRRGGFALAAAWLLSLAVLAGAAAASVAYREDIMRAWPPSARILG